MNIIILEDLKGFRKVVEVARFTPDYRIAEFKPLAVRALAVGEGNLTAQEVVKEIIFYPEGNPKQEYGTNICLYKQYD